jgi:hypothetical protein
MVTGAGIVWRSGVDYSLDPCKERSLGVSGGPPIGVETRTKKSPYDLRNQRDIWLAAMWWHNRGYTRCLLDPRTFQCPNCKQQYDYYFSEHTIVKSADDNGN